MTNYLEGLFSLRDRTALVTGGSSGIGFAIATALGKAGARVIVAARTRSTLDHSVEKLTEAGADASAIAADLGLRSDVDRLITEVDALGDLDILVNCAGVNIRRPMGELSDDDWSRTIAVNQTAPYLLGQHFGPRMAARGWGRIINVGSQQSVSAFGNSGAYGVAKAAIAGLSRSQSEAWAASGVCSNTIIPGFVVTPMTMQTIAEPGREEALAARSMIGRNAVPSDFCGAAVFLASDAGAYVTGHALFVDGGFSVH